ncbi:LuxR C-terminal-related transcriptional regulator [Streptomyces fuscichromogenes]|uniref:helix-turn-helix transcriptional regulator n=1 Tax=Streptomyces fuscichromogenes TaxID=1324013 RepID=UPI003825C868
MDREPGAYREPGEQAASDADAERRLLAADRLCPDSGAFLAALCVLAGEQPPATVARVASVPAAARIVDLLLGLGLVVRVEGPRGEGPRVEGPRGDGPDGDGPRGDGRIAFARESDHRLVRARLSPTRWRALHRAAAEVLDPGPALAHRAQAADRPDPVLAAVLEEAAFEAGAPEDGGGVGIGVPGRQLLLWAADLTADRGERERRVLLAAMHDVYGEEFRDDDLWTRVEALPPSPLRYCALAGRALLGHRLGLAVDHLRAASRALAAGDAHADATADRAPSTRSAAAAIETMRAAVACRTARGTTAVEAATRALDAAPGDPAQIRTARRLLLVGRAYTEGPHGVLRSLDEGPPVAGASTTVPELRDSALLLLRGECRVLAGDLVAGARDLDGLVRRHGARPAHPDRLRALERLAIAHFLLGSWREADSALAAIGEGPDDTAGRALRAMLAAVRGPVPPPQHGTPPRPDGSAPTDTSAPAGGSASAGRPVGGAVSAGWSVFLSRTAVSPGSVPAAVEPDRLTIAACADAVALLAHGRHADILTALAWLTSDSAGLADAPAKFAPLWLPVYVEAAVETAASAAAEAGLAQLREHAERSPYLMVTFHRLAGRAAELRRDPTTAAAAYEAGLLATEGHAPVPPLHRAQLDHAYGRFLCALGRTTTGLGWLQRAQDDFASLGADAFVRNCAQDRAAVTRGASPSPDVALTEREAMVVGLVASGLTNRQVAERLLISAKAVEYHLGKIYRKLGVRTRSELTTTRPSSPERSRWSG